MASAGAGKGGMSGGVLAAVAEQSENVGSPWMLVPVAALFIGLLWMAYRVAQGPKRAGRELGARPGWSYTERDDAVLAGFAGWPFGPNARAQAHQVVRGSHRGRPVVAFTARFTRTIVGGVVGFVGGFMSSGRRRAVGTQDLFEGISRTLGDQGGEGTVSVGRSRTRVTMVATEMPQALPAFLVRIQLPTDALLPGLRSNDLHLGEPHFDAAYLVRSEHPQLAVDLLTPANQQLLLRFSPFARGPHGGQRSMTLHDHPAHGFTMWTAGRQLIIVSNAFLDREGYDVAFDLMADFLDNVPAWVWDVAAGRGAAPSPAGSAPSPQAPTNPPTNPAAPSTPLSPSPISDG